LTTEDFSRINLPTVSAKGDTDSSRVNFRTSYPGIFVLYTPWRCS
jgi:hypothetical protein